MKIKMKKNIILGGLVASLFLGSCDSLAPESVDFEVAVDKTTVNVGEPVVFSFNGNPNFITFFSGEDGHKYANRNRTELDPADIASSTLSFIAESKYGTQTEALKVYLSKDFPGLNLKDADADKALIQGHAWDDITEACGLLDGKKVVVEDFDLSSYQGGFNLAFRFLGNTETAPQRTIIISNLTIRNELKNGSVTEVKGSDMNFSCFDVNPSNLDKDPYKKVVSGTAIQGTWNLIQSATLNKIQMQGGTTTHATWANNDDWLLTDRIKLNSCSPDMGENIKDINRRVTNYSYVFSSPGTYVVTFLAGNASVEGQETVLKEVTVEVKAAEE